MNSHDPLTQKMKQVLINEIPRARARLAEAARHFQEGDSDLGMDCLEYVYEAAGRWMETLGIPAVEVQSLRAAASRSPDLSREEAIRYVDTLSSLLETLFLGALDDSGALNNPEFLIMPSNN